MSAPKKAYLNRLCFWMKANASSSTIALVSHWVAKFIFGTRAAGGYSNVTSPVTTDANKQKVIANIKTQFHLDGLICVSNANYTKGFIGYVKENDSGTYSNRSFHNLTTRRGDRITLNGVNYILLNDAGLNTKGWGNVTLDYAFVNRIEGDAALVPPFYDSCTYTLQFSRDNGSTWQTCSAKFLNGVDAVGAHTNPGPEFFHSFGESSLTGTLLWRFTCVSPEGTVTLSNDTTPATLKPTAYLTQAERFTGSVSNNKIPSNITNGNGSPLQLFMYKADWDAIIAACRSYTPPVEVGHAIWSRGDRIAVGDAGLSSNMRVADSWKKLYNSNYRITTGFYLLTKDYGVQISGYYGYISHIFYAYVTSSGQTVPYIRLGIYIGRKTVDNEGVQTYALNVSFTAAYMNASETVPDFDTRLSFRIRWSTDGRTAAQQGVWFSDGTSLQNVTLDVTRAGGIPSFAAFSGYTESVDLDIQAVVIDNMTRKRIDTGADAMIDGQLIGVSEQYTRDIE